MQLKTHTTKKKLIIEYHEEESAIIDKRCTKCLEWRSVDDFPNLTGSFLNRNNHCNVCELQRAVKIRREKGTKLRPKAQIITDEVGNLTHKECVRCRVMFPLAMFSKNKNTTTGACSWCKPCEADDKLIRNYGINTKDKVLMFQTQNETCAICKLNIPMDKLEIDHCHSTGVVRGLLCNGCNTALGNMKDKIENCLNMIVYLQTAADRHTKQSQQEHYVRNQ